MTKAADIMAGEPPLTLTDVRDWLVEHYPDSDVLATIESAVNLFPLYEAVREAAEPILDRCLDFFGSDDLDPESSEAMPIVIKNRWAYDLRAALDALQAAEDVL